MLRLRTPSLVRVTGWVLPVHVYAGWQVETMPLDLGTGLREWVEVRHGEDVWHCADRVEAARLLARQGVDLRRFAQVDTIDDGCE